MTRRREVLSEAWRMSPAGFARRLTGEIWPPHLRLISFLLVLVATGRLPRLTVSLPPGHAKTTAISRIFPTWCFDLWPGLKLIGTSYGASIAVEHGKIVRELIEQNPHLLRVQLKGDTRAADAWQTTEGGGLWTAGAGGSITGRRANGAWVDDPHKNFDDAHSENSRVSTHNWWTSVMLTRRLPGAWELMVGTRWHEDDLIGHVLAGDDGETWASLVLPAVAEGDEDIDAVLGHNVCERLRAQGIVLPDWQRATGEALWPTTTDRNTGEVIGWFDREFLDQVRKDLGEYQWNALYQQHPSPPGGELFPASSWDRADAVPPKVPLIRFWDLAATEGGGDETAGVLMCRDHDGRTYIVDVVHGRWGPANVKKVLGNTAKADAETWGRRLTTMIEVEGGSGGKSWYEELVRGPLAGFNVLPGAPTGDKVTRSLGLAAQQQAGFVSLVRRLQPDGSFGPQPWFDALVEQARVFPHGRHDDLVDAASSAFNALIGKIRRPARVRSARARSLPERPRPGR